VGQGSDMTTGLSSRPLPAGECYFELLPEKVALVSRIGVFITMGWLAIAGILVASVLATQGFNISFPLLPVYIICALLTIGNSPILPVSCAVNFLENIRS